MLRLHGRGRPLDTFTEKQTQIITTVKGSLFCANFCTSQRHLDKIAVGCAANC